MRRAFNSFVFSFLIFGWAAVCDSQAQPPSSPSENTLSEDQIFEVAEKIYDIGLSGDWKKVTPELQRDLKDAIESLGPPKDEISIQQKAFLEQHKQFFEQAKLGNIETNPLLTDVTGIVMGNMETDPTKKVYSIAERQQNVRTNAKAVAVEYLILGELEQKLAMTTNDFMAIMSDGQKSALIRSIKALGNHPDLELQKHQIEYLDLLANKWLEKQKPSGESTDIVNANPKNGEVNANNQEAVAAETPTPKSNDQAMSQDDMLRRIKANKDQANKSSFKSDDLIACFNQKFAADNSNVNEFIDAVLYLEKSSENEMNDENKQGDTGQEAPKDEAAFNDDTRRLLVATARVTFWSKVADNIYEKFNMAGKDGSSEDAMTTLTNYIQQSSLPNEKKTNAESALKGLNETLKSNPNGGN